MTGMDAPLWNEKEVTAVVPYIYLKERIQALRYQA